jgi:23S rRNA U2552 (ribose-2'-O)-methylase RlmE/FtsJ
MPKRYIYTSNFTGNNTADKYLQERDEKQYIMRLRVYKDEEEYFPKILKIYEKNIYDGFTRIWEPIIIKINTSINTIKPLVKYNFYKYSKFNKLKDNIADSHNLRQEIEMKIGDILDKNEQYKYKKQIKNITEYYTRGLKFYVEKKRYVPHKISNAYMKLWEILSLFPELINENYDNDKKDFMVFQMAEAPGQFINCITRFLKVNRKNQYDYHWRANSLKPENYDNQKKYGKEKENIFGDDYNLIRDNPDKWIWGADGTGDIINTNNIKWYREYILKWSKEMKQNINLVTGDGGMIGSLEMMQKLDIAQMILTLATSQKGSSCVIKHFIPFINSIKNSYDCEGFFICLAYSYIQHYEYVYLTKPVTSNPNSGEVYIVGVNFKGIDDNMIDMYCDMLDNYKENHCWFEQDKLDKKVVKKIMDFIEECFELRLKQTKIRLILSSCFYKLNDNQKNHLQCNKMLSMDYHKETRDKIFNIWLKRHKFI